jgi:aminopeptidase YwaD
MNNEILVEKAKRYVNYLCNVKPNRRTGSHGNKEAVIFFKNIIEKYGFEVDDTPFNSMDYKTGKISLTNKIASFDIYVSPYSLGCHVKTNLVIAKSIKELEECNCTGKLLLLIGEICNEQLMPKKFVFYNPDHHKKIISLLEEKKPSAIITATSKKPELVGALYPFPLIEDGDFDIPNVYCTDKVGKEIEKNKNDLFDLQIEAERIPSKSSNIIAIKNPNSKEKIVIFAHIDAYGNSPGASDNASGTTVLLILAEFLKSYSGSIGIQIIAFNGEDHYSLGGQMDYIKRYSDSFKKIKLAVNIDDVGNKKGNISYSLYGCSDERSDFIKNIFNKYNSIKPGVNWYQGDHMIFVHQEKPSIAFTSENYKELMETITHSEKDIPENLDYKKIVELSQALYELIESFK